MFTQFAKNHLSYFNNNILLIDSDVENLKKARVNKLFIAETLFSFMLVLAAAAPFVLSQTKVPFNFSDTLKTGCYIAFAVGGADLLACAIYKAVMKKKESPMGPEFSQL